MGWEGRHNLKDNQGGGKINQQTIIPTNSLWRIVKESHPEALPLADRHYSRKHPGTKWFAGVGETLILLSYDNNALFVWRRSRFSMRQDGQIGIECTIFRNEGPLLSSDLIKDAERLAKEKWGPYRLFTYVDQRKIISTFPGYCFIRAGWRRLKQRSKDRGLIILEKYPTKEAIQ